MALLQAIENYYWKKKNKIRGKYLTMILWKKKQKALKNLQTLTATRPG